MRISAAPFAVLLALISCDRLIQSDNKMDDSRKITPKTLSNNEVPTEYLTLGNENSKGAKNESLSGSLFSRFFCDRAEFYVIENPQNEIYLQRPTSIVLYYLDGELCQTKYEFKENIADRLFGELGRCRIVGLDLKNKMIVDSKSIRVESGSGILFNPELDNFELRWIFGNKEIKYRVQRIKNRSKFVYTEKLRNYEREFSRIEKYC